MTELPSSFQDLLSAPGVGVLTTIGPDGSPQTTALWFLHQDGQIRLSLNSSRQKTRNLARDPRVSFFLMDPANPYRTLEVRGTAVVTPDADYAFAEQVGAKYGGVNLRDNDREGETRVIVTIEPGRVITFPPGA
ncbi:MAG TPA: PPOX class F420-dependent oxidoreductase [Thermomicrobiales bacterium]|jgi:PPOX class probable F420-dependent enzyme|nr:PPOX class F420-dependent oxidoreductase [Thermomicrobiales bacterium]